MKTDNLIIIGYKGSGKDKVCEALGIKNKEFWGSKYHSLTTFLQSKNTKLNDYKVIYCVKDPWEFIFEESEDPEVLQENNIKELAFTKNFYSDKNGNIVNFAAVIDCKTIVKDLEDNNLEVKQNVGVTGVFKEDVKMFYKSHPQLNSWIKKYFKEYNDTFGYSSPLDSDINNKHVGSSLNNMLEETGDLDEVKKISEDKKKKYKFY